MMCGSRCDGSTISAGEDAWWTISYGRILSSPTFWDISNFEFFEKFQNEDEDEDHHRFDPGSGISIQPDLRMFQMVAKDY